MKGLLGPTEDCVFYSKNRRKQSVLGREVTLSNVTPKRHKYIVIVFLVNTVCSLNVSAISFPSYYFYSFQNFLALCASNYYNGCIFHRNIKGFMVQTGDPTGKLFY